MESGSNVASPASHSCRGPMESGSNVASPASPPCRGPMESGSNVASPASHSWRGPVEGGTSVAERIPLHQRPSTARGVAHQDELISMGLPGYLPALPSMQRTGDEGWTDAWDNGWSDGCREVSREERRAALVSRLRQAEVECSPKGIASPWGNHGAYATLKPVRRPGTAAGITRSSPSAASRPRSIPRPSSSRPYAPSSSPRHRVAKTAAVTHVLAASLDHSTGYWYQSHHAWILSAQAGREATPTAP